MKYNPNDRVIVNGIPAQVIRHDQYTMPNGKTMELSMSRFSTRTKDGSNTTRTNQSSSRNKAMHLTRQIDALEQARQKAAEALRLWQDHMFVETGNRMAHSEPLAAFTRTCDEEIDKLETRLRMRELEFAKPVLRARFFDPSRPIESGESYIVRPPSRELDEPHIYEDTWECVKKYLQGENCLVDEDFDVYVIARRPPHAILHVIRGAKKKCIP